MVLDKKGFGFVVILFRLFLMFLAPFLLSLIFQTMT